MKKENELYSFSSQEVVSVSEKDKQTVEHPEIRQIPIGQLQDFKGHPFKVEQDNTLFELMLSIEKEGVIVPALARPSKDGKGYELHAVMDLEQCTPSLSQANRIKRLSQSEELDMDAMYLILEQEKPNQREQIKIRTDVLDDYFPTDFTPKQKVDLIQQLVKEWHERQAELRIQQTNKKKERGTGR